MEGFYSNCPSGYGNPWWWDNIASNANSLATSGFTAVWLPPAIKGNSGGYSTGYDPFDDYDLGSKNQKGSIPTHYGTRQQLERACAMLHANGIQVYEDIVDNHRDGDDGSYHFNYADAYGNATGGRFGKSTWDFHPNVSQDPNVPDGNSEINFGRDLAPVNGATAVIGGQTWVWADYGLKQALDWQTKALDLNGYRLDYVRGISSSWLYSFLTYGAMNGKFAVGENTDGNVASLNNWIQSSMQNRCSAFDFPLHDGYLVPMCNNPGSFNMASLDHAGLTGVNPGGSVTFVENHDTDGSNPITQNKLMGYAYILTSEGYPCVFYRDWSTASGSYGSGLQAGINNLVWIHEKIASGSTQQRWKNSQIFTYERMGGNHLLVGLNADTGSAHTITCATGFGANRQLHDYTGHSGDTWTDGSGNATITIPVNSGGTGYVCYSVTGISGAFTASQNSTTQEYAGAQDLDIKPADNTGYVPVGTINVASGKLITGSLYYDTASWTGSTTITLQLVNPSGTVVGTKTYTSATAQGSSLSYTATVTGNYTFNIRSASTPAGNLKPNYWLRMTYTAPQF
jgi:alpha-amylase